MSTPTIVTTGRQIIYIPPGEDRFDPPVCTVNPQCLCGISLDPNVTTTVETRRLHFPDWWPRSKWDGGTWCEVNEICCGVSGSGAACPQGTIAWPCCNNAQICQSLQVSIVCAGGFHETFNIIWNGSIFTGTGPVFQGHTATVSLSCVGGVERVGASLDGGAPQPFTRLSETCSPYESTWNGHVGGVFGTCGITIQDLGAGASGSGQTITTYVQKQRIFLPPGWTLGPGGCVVNDCTDACLPDVMLPCCPAGSPAIPQTLYLAIVSLTGAPPQCSALAGIVIPLIYSGSPGGVPTYVPPGFVPKLLVSQGQCSVGGGPLVTYTDSLFFKLELCKPISFGTSYTASLTIISQIFTTCPAGPLPRWSYGNDGCVAFGGGLVLPSTSVINACSQPLFGTGTTIAGGTGVGDNCPIPLCLYTLAGTNFNINWILSE